MVFHLAQCTASIFYVAGHHSLVEYIVRELYIRAAGITSIYCNNSWNPIVLPLFMFL